MSHRTRLAISGATLLVAAFEACAPPPSVEELPSGTPQAGKSGAGATGGTGGTAGGGGTGVQAGRGGSKGGKGGAKGGSSGSGGSSVGARGGTGGSGGSTGGTAAGEAGASGQSGAGGEGGAPSAGQAGAGGEGGVPVDVCAGVTIGTSKIPAGPATGVSQPAGTPGNFKVLNWAGFKGALSFTFDDSLQSQITHYTELNAVGVHMTFYDVCNNDGSAQAWKTAVADGHELGNHTMHHCNANGTGCGWPPGGFTTVDAELDDCTAHIKSVFGVTPYTMAAPMGDDGWITPASTRFLANRGVYDDPNGVAPNDSSNPFRLPCHIAAQDEKAVGGFNTVTDSVRSKGVWKIILNHALGANDGYHPVDPAEVVAAMTYARDLKDVWVDTVVSIAAYWRAQKVLSQVTPTTAGSNTTWAWTLPDHFPPGQYLRVTVDGGTLTQCGTPLVWDDHGYYEIALDAGSVTLSP